jgi:hypothetical protein
VYSYLYHFVLCLFLLGVAIIAMMSTGTLQFEVLPWKGDDLVQWLVWGSLAGILSIVLAVTGIFRYLFPIWALLVLVMLIRGYLLQPYAFAGREPFYQTLWLIGGALVAFLASLTLFRRTKKRRF